MSLKLGFLLCLCGVVILTEAHLLGRPKSRHGMLGEPLGVRIVKKDPEIHWMTQRLDHFNPADTRTWKQRYMVQDEFYKIGGPVFLMLGGEGEASPKWLSANTFIMILAKKYNALVYQLEHRYYGKSRPTPDMSTENLAYLTSQQALADAAFFRGQITRSHHFVHKTNWVVFGGSYSGALAAWFKLKYPHLAVGAVASSAPLYAVIDFKDYLRVVRDSLATSSPDCNAQVEAAFGELMMMVGAPPATWHNVSSLFRTCGPFDGFQANDVANFFQSVAGAFEGIVQYNKDQRISGVSNVTIDTLCDIMISKSGSALERLAQASNVVLQSTGEKCLDYDYDNFVNTLRNISFDNTAIEGGRQWTYQTCVEFGYFQSSDYKDQPFGNQFPVDFFVQQCRDIFGAQFDAKLLADAVFWTNTYYGALHPQLRNVTFPNGSIDPWHALGVTKDISDDVTAIFIDGTAHCADMYPPSATDNANLSVARQKIDANIAKWISASTIPLTRLTHAIRL